MLVFSWDGSYCHLKLAQCMLTILTFMQQTNLIALLLKMKRNFENERFSLCLHVFNSTQKVNVHIYSHLLWVSDSFKGKDGQGQGSSTCNGRSDRVGHG